MLFTEITEEKTSQDLNEIEKGQKDSNGYTKCWPGKHAEGTKKGKNGGQVRDCVPNESVEEQATKTLEERMDEAIAWLDEAAPAYTGIDPVVRSRMGMPPATQGEIRDYLSANPPVWKSGSGQPITTGTPSGISYGFDRTPLNTIVGAGGAQDVARAADAASPDRDQAVAKPPVSTSPPPSVSAAITPRPPVVKPPVAAPPPPAAKPPVKTAQTFSKDVTNLATANKIADPNKINVGQTIKLPTGQNYTVAKGDTLSGIASGQFKGASDQISKPPAATTPAVKPYAPSTTTPVIKPMGPGATPTTTAPPPAVKPAAPAASAPVATPPPAVKTPTPPAASSAPPAAKPGTTPIKTSGVPVPADKNVYIPNTNGIGQKGPTKAAATGFDPTNSINVPPYGTGNSTPPPVMFNKLPTGTFGATKESSELSRIKSLAGLK